MPFQLFRTVSSYSLDVEYTAYYIPRYFFFMDGVKWEIAGTIMEQIMRPLDSFAYDMIVWYLYRIGFQLKYSLLRN